MIKLTHSVLEATTFLAFQQTDDSNSNCKFTLSSLDGRNSRQQACSMSPSSSRFQYFPSLATPTYNYFPTPSIDTFQILYHGVKTSQIGSNTFQHLEPTLSPKYIIYHSTKTFQISTNTFQLTTYQNFLTFMRVFILKLVQN